MSKSNSWYVILKGKSQEIPSSINNLKEAVKAAQELHGDDWSQVWGYDRLGVFHTLLHAKTIPDGTLRNLRVEYQDYHHNDPPRYDLHLDRDAIWLGQHEEADLWVDKENVIVVMEHGVFHVIPFAIVDKATAGIGRARCLRNVPLIGEKELEDVLSLISEN